MIDSDEAYEDACIARLAEDYFGNSVISKIFEYGTGNTKLEQNL
jgi:hypothetical protein